MEADQDAEFQIHNAALNESLATISVELDVKPFTQLGLPNLDTLQVLSITKTQQVTVAFGTQLCYTLPRAKPVLRESKAHPYCSSSFQVDVNLDAEESKALTLHIKSLETKLTTLMKRPVRNLKFVQESSRNAMGRFAMDGDGVKYICVNYKNLKYAEHVAQGERMMKIYLHAVSFSTCFSVAHFGYGGVAWRAEETSVTLGDANGFKIVISCTPRLPFPKDRLLEKIESLDWPSREEASPQDVSQECSKESFKRPD